MECLDEGPEWDVDADDSEEHAQEDDETVVGDGTPVQGGTFEFQVEVAGPDEGEHGAREAADEAHEDGEVGNGDGHHDGEDHHAHA